MKTKNKIAPEQRQCVSLIKQARRKGHTLEQMAVSLGVSFSTVSRWENGRVVPHRNTSIRLVPLLKELVA